MKLLLIHYGPGPNSVTDKVASELRTRLHSEFELEEVDLVEQQPEFFTKQSMAAYIKRNYQGEELTPVEATTLAVADGFADQFLQADVLVMVFPMYNFSVPAAVKGWIDNVAQAKKTFRYGEYGPEGLSKVQKAVIVPITGATPANTSKDFITAYMDTFLKFVGVKSIDFVGIAGTKFMGESVHQKIDEVVRDVESVLKSHRDQNAA